MGGPQQEEKAMMVLVAALVAALTTGGAVKLEQRTVVKSRVYLVKEPSFLASRTSRTLNRGEKIEVEQPGQGSWLRAHVGEEQGYIHLSYVSRPPNEFKVSGGAVAPKVALLESGEHSLAVGGFTELVERTWRQENPNLEQGFRRLEPYMPALPAGPEGLEAEAGPPLPPEPNTPDPAALAAFAAEGGLRLALEPSQAQEAAP